MEPSKLGLSTEHVDKVLHASMRASNTFRRDCVASHVTACALRVFANAMIACIYRNVATFVIDDVVIDPSDLYMELGSVTLPRTPDAKFTCSGVLRDIVPCELARVAIGDFDGKRAPTVDESASLLTGCNPINTILALDAMLRAVDPRFRVACTQYSFVVKYYVPDFLNRTRIARDDVNREILAGLVTIPEPLIPTRSIASELCSE